MLKFIRHFFAGIQTDLFHSSILLSGSILAQLISVIAYPVLTRLYNPVQFGQFSVFLSITGILAIISTGRLEYALIISEDEKDAGRLKTVSFWWCIVFSLLCLIACFFIGLNKPLADKIPGLYIIPLSVFLTGVIQIFTFYRNRLKQYKRLAQVSVAQNLSATGTKISLGLLGFNFSGLIAGSILGQAAAVITLSGKYLSGEIFSIPVYAKQILGKYSAFPKYRMIQAIINSLSSNMPILLLTYFFAARHAGFYGIVLGIGYKIITLITSAMYPVLFRRFSELYNNEKTILPLYIKYVSLLALLGFLPGIVIFIFSKPLVIFFLGDNWLETSDYIRMMIPWLMMTFVAMPFSFIADVYSKQKMVLIIDVIHLFARILALFTGFWFNLVYLSVTLYSLVSVAFLLLILTWYYYLIKKGDEIAGKNKI